MGYRPKRLSELLVAISELYEEKEYYRNGEEKRGGRRKKKEKTFFKVSTVLTVPLPSRSSSVRVDFCLLFYPTAAHLTRDGIQYSEDDSSQELKDKLQEAMSARPPPRLPHVMRQRWLNTSEERTREVAEHLQQEGHTIYNSGLFADPTGVTSLTDQFFNDLRTFFWTHFPPTAPPNHVFVLMDVDTLYQLGVWEWACDLCKMRVEKVENSKGWGFNRGRYAEFAIRRDVRSVKAKAEEIKRANEAARDRVKFMPYLLIIRLID